MLRQSWRPRFGLAMAGVLGLIVLAGCGRGPDNVGRVSGKVTLDGQPLAHATVMFSPQQAGSPSVAVTDASGQYALHYTALIPGALAGAHRVTVSTFTAGDPDADPPVARVAERVPFKYNLRSELTATVHRGRNAVDFALASDGPVVQPDSMRARDE